MPQATDQVTSVKHVTDDEMAENHGLANASHGETPYFGKKYSTHLWGRHYRINYYHRDSASVSRSLFVTVVGQGNDRQVVDKDDV